MHSRAVISCRPARCFLLASLRPQNTPCFGRCCSAVRRCLLTAQPHHPRDNLRGDNTQNRYALYHACCKHAFFPATRKNTVDGHPSVPVVTKVVIAFCAWGSPPTWCRNVLHPDCRFRVHRGVVRVGVAVRAWAGYRGGQHLFGLNAAQPPPELARCAAGALRFAMPKVIAADKLNACRKTLPRNLGRRRESPFVVATGTGTRNR